MIMNAVLEILPFALASAVSPLLLTFSILVLSSPQKGLQKAWLFVLGNAITITIVGSLIILLNIGVKQNVSEPSLVDIAFGFLAGVLLILIAIRQFLKKPKPTQQKTTGKDNLLKYLVLGMGLMLSNYSTIIMYFPAATILSTQFHTTDAKIYGLITMIVFSLVPSLIGPVVTVLLGKHAGVVLVPLQKFVSKYGHILVAILFGAIGIFLIFKAVNKFLGINGWKKSKHRLSKAKSLMLAP